MVLTPSTATKRKNDENVSVAAPPKKARVAGNGAHAAAAVLLKTILANPKSFPAPASADAVRDALVDLAVYANALEEQNRALRVANNAKPAAPVAKAVKSKDELEVEAERIRNAAQNGIIKQMAWKPTCKQGRAKWSYDGFCPDPEVFGVLMGLGGTPKFKVKKFKAEAFEELIGELDRSVRYDVLHITSADVTVRWNETGEFKFSGSYGKLPKKD
ncbi:hypothetical protein VTO73DRAFT_7097 [Trametes versicolor]